MPKDKSTEEQADALCEWRYFVAVLGDDVLQRR